MGMQGRKNPNAGRKEIKIDVDRVRQLSSQGLTEEQIASVLGINWKTLVARKNKYKEYSEALQAGKNQGIAQVANAMYQNAMNGHFPAQKFYLCNRDRDNWQDKPEIEANINTTIIHHLDIEKDL